MRNGYKIIVFMIVISFSQEVEITTFVPPNSTVLVTTPHEEPSSNESSSHPGVTQIIPESSKSSSDISIKKTEEDLKPQTVLEYKPLKPFHQPHLPINQVVPSGKPLSESAETAKPTKQPIQTFPQDLVDRFPELTTLNNKRTSTPNIINNRQPETTTDNYVKPVTVLGYKPITSFYYPEHITLSQIIPPGTPWPASPGEQGSSPETTTTSPKLVRKTTTTIRPQTKKTKISLLASRKTTTRGTTASDLVTTTTTTEGGVKPITILEYQPTTTFFHPHPVTVGQIIPPGKPWPASPEGYLTTLPPNLDDNSPDLVSKTTTTSKTHTESVESQTVLNYKPVTSFHIPNPATLAQIVPPGKPWPASAEDYQTTKVSYPITTSSPDLDDSALGSFSNKTTINKTPTIKTTQYVESQTILNYKPITPFYHPRPVTIAQLIPPGKPLPGSAEEANTKPPTPQRPQTLAPDLIDRFPELVSIKTTTTKTTKRKPTISSVKPTTPSEGTVLTYKPQRPWYHPRPGNTVNQIVPPGKPWPSSPSGYPSFSVTTRPPWAQDSGDNELPLGYYKVEELQSLKDEPSLEPNALQYYGPPITARPMYNKAATPFTSGTQKTTISDIVDILKEVHNITLVSGNAPPSPSHLLPFDVDKGPVGSALIRRPPSQGQQNVRPPVQVYDGAAGSSNRERIFSNPKFVQKR